MATHNRPFLVLVRAGERSLHRAWLEGSERNWDLVVSWYGDTPYVPVADEKVVNIKGGCWDGVYKTFQAMPELLEQYTHFWLPDDDLEADARTINDIFELSTRHNLAVSQPALTHDSYFFHPHTLQSPSFILRYTTFVEVMAPCMRRDVLRKMLPFMQDNKTGFGLDFVWARLEEDNLYRAAILDEVTIRHTRPVGRFLAGRVKAAGGELDEAKSRLLKHFNMKEFAWKSWCYAGIDRRSGKRRGALATRAMMVRDYLGKFSQWKTKRRFRPIRKHLLQRWRLTSTSQLRYEAPPNAWPVPEKRND